MASLEANKVCAAVLVAGVAFMLSSVIGDSLVHAPRLEKSAITTPAAPGASSAVEAPDPPVATLLASADAAKGKLDTTRAGCVACHTFDQGGKPGIGPNLYGVVGAPHGHESGFDYSSALKAKAGPWTYDELYEWLKKPSAYAPGTKMTFVGMSDPKERADVIAYLRSLSADPMALPAAPAAAPAGAAPGQQATQPSANQNQPQTQQNQSQQPPNATAAPPTPPAK